MKAVIILIAAVFLLPLMSCAASPSEQTTGHQTSPDLSADPSEQAAGHQTSPDLSADPSEQTAGHQTPPDMSANTSEQTPTRQALPDLFASPIGRNSSGSGGGRTASVEDTLEMGLQLAEVSPVHLVIRGTAGADSVRCEWRGVARTPEQREQAIRFWLNLGTDDALPSPAEAERLMVAGVDQSNAAYPATLKANLRALAHGGVSTDYRFLTCYVNFAVSEFLVGAGASSLTVAYDRIGEERSYGLYKLAHAAGEFGDQELLEETTYQAYLDRVATEIEIILDVVVEGYESVVFLAPMGAHNAIAVEGWQAVAQWDLQTDEEGILHAVRYGAGLSDPEYTQTLTNLKSRITAAAASDEFAGERIANASGLTQYYRDIGAYGDITPDDGSTDTFTPTQPPPVPPCAGSTATEDSPERALIRDCGVLLAIKDTLSGAAALNWSKTLDIGNWNGVTVSGTPQRVTGLSLPSSSLSGAIPAELGTLQGLTALDLSSNSLTGSIPAELGGLTELDDLKLSGNPLQGCIPPALRTVEANDLASLGLSFCDMLTPPPAPGGVSVTLAEGKFTIGWDAVSGASGYEVRHRTGDLADWTALPETETTSATYTPEARLTCETTYRFRVRAYGDGVMHSLAWGDPSEEATHDTETCNPPVFDQDSYNFTVDESALTGLILGTVSATDPDEEDIVSYSITAGNGEGKFAVDEDTGVVTVAAALDYEAASSHTLTVRAEDGKGGESAASVSITVASVCRNGVVVPNPSGNSGLVDDCLVLYGAKETLAGSASLNWSSGTALNEWEGVGLRGQPVRVQYLLLGSYELNGTIPAVLGNLSELRRLDLDGNSLTGEIPPELGNLTHLTNLYLQHNRLNGGIPAELGNLSNLQELSLGYNRLTGPIPAELSMLSSLRLLVLNDNRLTGSIPQELGDMESLSELWVPRNHLSGRLPVRLGRLELESLYLSENSFQGCLPHGLRSVPDNDLNFREMAAMRDCPNEAPAFSENSYSFTVSEEAATGEVAGSVSAEDPDGRTVAYAITAGNGEGKFGIDTGNGALSVAGGLDYETATSYYLTVRATDADGATAEVSVAISVAEAT